MKGFLNALEGLSDDQRHRVRVILFGGDKNTCLAGEDGDVQTAVRCYYALGWFKRILAKLYMDAQEVDWKAVIEELD